MADPQDSLHYHAEPRPGKLEVAPTKSLRTQEDLSLAYTPGVAQPVLEIAREPQEAYRYTAKGNLVAVVTNGTAILGLGDKGPLAAKPVMEGKAVLFKRFADVDAIDLEIDCSDPVQFIEIVAALAPTFGGINLEDIKAPECFSIEQELKKRLPIPVFHDDQHGTAVVVGAALLNAVEVAGKNISQIRIVVSGAGAAGLAIARFLLLLGVDRAALVLCDSHGVVSRGRRENMNTYKREFATPLPARTLAEALRGADVFIGVSQANILTQDMVRAMADHPIVFAMANPDPEIGYEHATAARGDLIIGTGRSDTPNQVNNVLCFPFLFRGALDVRASSVNDAMLIAAARALAVLAREDVPPVVLEAYGLRSLSFGREYLLPKPFDPRLIAAVAPAVAQAAMESGVARASLDPQAYPAELRERMERLQQRLV